MPALYELAGPPIPYPPGGGAGELLLSNGRFLRWRPDSPSDRSGIIGDIVDANGAPTGITFHLIAPGFDHSVAALDDGGFAFVYHNDQTSPNGTHEIYLSIFDSAGTQVVAPFQVNSHIQGVQANARVAVTAGGQIVVTWTDQSGVVDDGNSAVRARMFNPDGSTFGAEFLVNTTTVGAQHRPMVTALEGGGFVVFWLSEAQTGNFQVFDANGAKIGPERAITYVGNDTVHHPANDIQALSNGGFAVTYGGSVNNQSVGVLAVFDSSGNQVALLAGFPDTLRISGAFEDGFVTGASGTNAIFDNLGVQQGAAFNGGIAEVFPADDGAFKYFTVDGAVTVRPDDGTGAAEVEPSTSALSETTPQNNLVALLSTSGVALNSAYTYEVVSDSLGGAFDVVGNRLILVDNANLDFETAASVTVTVSATDANGNQYLDTFTLDVTDEIAEQRITGSPVMDPFGTSLFQLAGGNYVALSLTFPSSGVSQLSGQLFGPDLSSGQAFDVLDVRLANLYFAVNYLALPSGGFVVTWTADGTDGAGGTVLARAFDANADPVSPVVQVNTTTAFSQLDSAVTLLPGGRLLFAWEDQGAENAGGIRYQLFDAALNKIGAELALNSTVLGSQVDVSLQALQSGGVLATWGDRSQTGGDSSMSGIKGQLLDADGQKVGGEFLVNTTTAGDQVHSSAIALASGQVLVTWQSAPAQLSPGQFMGQLFDLNGAKVGGELVLESYNSATVNVADLPYRLIALSSGGFALAWTDSVAAPDGGGTSVWARLFDSAGAATSGKFLVNVDPADAQRIADLTLLGDGNIYIAWTTEFGGRDARIFDPTGTTTDWAVNDTLAGTAGADVLRGGLGNDRYIVNHPGDVVIEAVGEGTDIIYSSVSYSLNDGSEVESLSTITWEATTPLNLNGNSLNNQLIGNAGANRLDGKAGADTMFGREGNDTYVVDNAGDKPVEAAGGGIDAVYTSISYTLAANTDIEGLATISFGATNAINLTGNGLANNMIGNDGANQLDGKAGADTMTGRAGNDKYLVDNAGDRVFEAAGGGTDVVYTGVSFVLTDAQEIEGLSTITWELTTAINLTGNGLKNNIIGNAGANVLDGKGGNDTLQGREGADSYAFTTVLGAGNIDAILGFSSVDDTILLENNGVFVGLAVGALNANAFVIDVAAQDADDRIVYNQATGQLYYDSDGVGGTAAILFATLTGAPVITANDFTVI